MASVKQNTSNHPYTADATTLPVAFENLSGTLPKGRRLRTRFTVGGSTAKTVSCFVNGVRVVQKQSLDGSRVFSAAIPSAAFTAAQGEPNCVSFIAYDSSGNVVARNYALVTQGPSDATTLIFR